MNHLGLSYDAVISCAPLVLNKQEDRSIACQLIHRIYQQAKNQESEKGRSHRRWLAKTDRKQTPVQEVCGRTRNHK